MSRTKSYAGEAFAPVVATEEPKMASMPAPSKAPNTVVIKNKKYTAMVAKHLRAPSEPRSNCTVYSCSGPYFGVSFSVSPLVGVPSWLQTAFRFDLPAGTLALTLIPTSAIC
mmetsp:Transcript_11125/g.23506  ORF Transcript_11125/g.23506 Transcript_11125/m.23506 type:complete len:112 (-) Transcript_11125:904-1239(-)